MSGRTGFDQHFDECGRFVLNKTEEVVLTLCDAEEEYAGLMTEYMEKQKNLPWHVRTYTDVKKMMEAERETDIMLVAESVYCDEIRELEPKRLIVLNESGIIRDRTLRYINKYQEADQVLREILAIYLEIASEVLPRIGETGKTVFVGFFSPVRRCMQTTFAMTMAQLLAQEHKTLYLNFEYFAGNQELLPDLQTRDLADLLYFLNADKDKFSLRLQSIVRQVGELAYIPPMKSGQNLLSITAKEWLFFFQKLQEEGEYEYVVMDLSECMQGLFEILRSCRKVYTVTGEDKPASGKLIQYEKLLEMHSCEDILAKTVRLTLPRIRQLPERLEFYGRSELADYVKEQLKELMKEG